MSGKVFPAPLGPMTTWQFRRLFTAEDATAIAEHVARPLDSKRVEDLVSGLNEAVLLYLVAARREAAGNASDFEQWAERVARASAAFLAALGVDPADRWQQVITPQALPLRAFQALCARMGSSLTEARYPDGFPYMEMLNHATRGAKVAHDVAEHAARYYAAQKKSSSDAARKGLSARQTFILELAPVFEAAFPGERMTSSPHAGQSPFLRFVRRVFVLVVERVTPESGAITLPDDGADSAAAAALARASESRIADDIRSKVYEALQQRRNNPPQEWPGVSTGEIIRRLRG